MAHTYTSTNRSCQKTELPKAVHLGPKAVDVDQQAKADHAAHCEENPHDLAGRRAAGMLTDY